MLDSSKTRLAEAPAGERDAAERFAASWMTTMLEQDLIPADEARAVVAQHRTEMTEEWARSVHAALVGLQALKT